MSRENRLLAVAVAAVAGVLLPLGFAYPHLMIEDGPVETAAAAGFAITCLVALGLLASGRKSGQSLARRFRLGGLLAFALLLFLSEISFGARLFDLRMPAMPGGGEFDGGHDIVILLYRAIRDAGPAGWAMAAAAAAACAVAVALLRRRLAPMLRHVAGDALAFRVTTIVALLATAVLLDLVDGAKVAVVEETLELLASGVLLRTALGFVQLPASPALGLAPSMAPADASTHPSRR